MASKQKVVEPTSTKNTQSNQNQIKQKVEMGTQTDLIERDYIPIKQLAFMQTESVAFPQILYHQHTLLQLILFFIMIFITSFYYTSPQSSNSLIENAKMGVIFSMISIVVYCMIYLPNTIIQRPHPSLWRMLQGFGMCWLCLVVFALFFNRQDLQSFLSSVVDPKLGKPLTEKNFSEDCNIYTPNNPKGPFANVIDKLDIFFIAHFVGWLVKMLICRNFWLCMVQSVLFEFLEITFRHWLPNFYECWWDSVIFDLILCNSGGIITGWWLMKNFQMKEYRWSVIYNKQKSFFQNFQHLFLTPNLEVHDWKVFSSSLHFASVIYYIIFMNMVDLSFFFNKYVLWLKPSHPILAFRTFMIGFLSIPATREYFEYITNPLQKRLGGICWLAQAIVFTEFLVFFKNYNGQFNTPFPGYVLWIWIAIISATLITFIGLFIKDVKKWQILRQQKKQEKLHNE